MEVSGSARSPQRQRKTEPQVFDVSNVSCVYRYIKREA